MLFVPAALKEISVRWLVGVKERKHNKSGTPKDEERVYEREGTAFRRAKFRPSELRQVDDQKRNAYGNTVTQHRKDVDLILLFHGPLPFPGTVRVMSTLTLSILARAQSSTSFSSGMATTSNPDAGAAQNMLIHGVGPGQDDLADAVLLAAAAELVD